MCSNKEGVLPAGDEGCQRAQHIHHTIMALSQSVEGHNVSAVA